VSFHHPITVKRALDGIATHEYVLPAIQREFVWKTEQVCRLFDSLMRRYPIGSFLFWKVSRETSRRFSFYDFVLNYHQWLHPHCPRLTLNGDREVIAILDGQQRLTALNIGLRGSLAVKLPRKRWRNLDAYPVRVLHLNLLAEAEDNESGVQYDFRFLKKSQGGLQDEDRYWFPLSRLLDCEEQADLPDLLTDLDALPASS